MKTPDQNQKNPIDVFLESLGSEGIALALIKSFARVNDVLESEPQLARDSLLVIARSLPPTQEWRGLSDALEKLGGGSTVRKTYSVEEKQIFQQKMEQLKVRARLVPGGWNAELDAEFNALMDQYRKR